MALLSCLTIESASTVSRVDLLPNSEETFDFMDLDDNNEVSLFEFGKAFLDHTKRSHAQITEHGLIDVSDERANGMLRRTLATQRKAIKEVFDARNANGDSVLDLEESLGPSRAAEIFTEFIGATFETMDASSDKVISLDEYSSAMKQRLDFRFAEIKKIESEVNRQEASALMDLRLTRQFKKLDSNKDGHLSQSEVEEVKNRPVISNPHPPNAVQNFIENQTKKANSTEPED